MHFLSDAIAEIEGLLEVNRDFCKKQMAEKASPALPTNCAVVPLMLQRVSPLRRRGGGFPIAPSTPSGCTPMLLGFYRKFYGSFTYRFPNQHNKPVTWACAAKGSRGRSQTSSVSIAPLSRPQTNYILLNKLNFKKELTTLMPQESKAHRLWTLFSSMLLISTFTFGGGFVIVSLMKKKFVDELHYLTEEEMLDMTALAQTAPGAIAVNGAILVGRRIAGISGLIVAVLATILPPIVIISVISMMYAAFAENEWVRAVLTGMQSGVAAVICDVTANLGGKVVQSKDWLNLLLMAGAFVASAVFHVNVIVVILVAAAIGVIRALLARKGGVSA